ncbi:AraC family transcriptional regulator [Consotaella aegiceratis]|uniref:AraC family transcriptional regulator n=1 Tax=Consotaella aegiceratis TaxID=3097961 RepID=UPI002F3F3F78
MPHSNAATFDDYRRPSIIALGVDYPDGHVEAPHRHRRGQLLYGSTGVVMVATDHGAWMMPPLRGLWIPPGTLHEVRMLGTVGMRSLYVEPDAVRRLPDRCQVVAISSLLRALLAEAVTVPADYDQDGRDGALMTFILHELCRLKPLPLSLPLPRNEALAQLCRTFLLKPTPHTAIDAWSDRLGMSRRTFTRLFRRETGMSFGSWRQQACIMAALPRLTAGERVTTVAIDLGYDNPAAFTATFKRVLGRPPLAYLAADEETAQPSAR